MPLAVCKGGRSEPCMAQVAHCGAELVNEKSYYKRYRCGLQRWWTPVCAVSRRTAVPALNRARLLPCRICKQHCSAPSMELDARTVRFCQQCGRFQDIGEARRTGAAWLP